MGYALTTVVVTGAAGYLGAHVADLLDRQGFTAIRVGRSADSDIRCDLLESRDCEALVSRYPEAVFVHCAAVVPSDSRGYTDTVAAVASLEMVKNLAHARPRRVVFPSSMTVYPAGVGMARETDARTPDGGYAWGKLAAEQVLLDQLGDRTTILRIPGLFGPPRRNGLLYNVARNLATGRAPELSTTLPQWSAIHVEDAAEICVRAALRPTVAAGVMNAGYSDAMSIPDAVERLSRIFDNDVSVSPAPAFSFDLTRLERELGPLRGDFQTRLEQLAGWVKREVGQHDD
ncbi:MAG: NAD(P)-dependent oxidoreductase [Devosia ginsengisoli]|nr:NAD(P)-dependent oxidoreductase [Devosia ginsengisoli]MCR6672050.1 NAD(P)-dependent oxidoreductase [Devosia ginsengisoli]